MSLALGMLGYHIYQRSVGSHHCLHTFQRCDKWSDQQGASICVSVCACQGIVPQPLHPRWQTLSLVSQDTLLPGQQLYTRLYYLATSPGCASLHSWLGSAALSRLHHTGNDRFLSSCNSTIAPVHGTLLFLGMDFQVWSCFELVLSLWRFSSFITS